jgi:TPR repeat protein
MTTTNRRTSRTPRLLLLPALLLLTPAYAQTGTPANAPGTVIVSGQRQGANDPHQVNAAKDRILNGHAASSCAFMDPHNPKYDPIYTAYMSDFGLDNAMSNDVDRFSDLAPGGDVSNAVDSSGIPAVDAGAPGMGSTDTAGCGPADRRFAAGRNEIARKDKTLAFGYEAFDNKDYPRALEMFTTAWNKVGYDEAALMLARLNLYGLGTPKDGAKAVAWLEKVADGRFDPSTDVMRFDPSQPGLTTPKVDAAFMLARIYERGIGVVSDQHKAVAWYEKAAQFGFVPALDIVGKRELGGIGARRDPARAVGHLKEAADAGYVPAQFDLARAYYGGDGIPKDLKLAGAYFDAAAHAGLPAAMFAAGRMYDLGEGVKTDQSKAIVYYKDAALKGDADAQFALGTYFYTGEVVGKNPAVARKWFDAAAHHGQPDAMFNLGVMTANGEGGARDRAVAYVWFALAQEAGHDGAAAAMKALGSKLSADERKRADAVLKPQLAKAR